MNIEDSSLWNEISDIMQGGELPVHATWDVTIFNGTDSIKPLKVVAVEFNQDYLNNYTDAISVECIIPLGIYAKRIYPFQDILEIELSRIQIGESSESIDADATPQVERYTAVMVEDKSNPVINGDIGQISSEEDLNRIDIPKITFQLVNKSLEQIRAIAVGGVYRECTGEDVVKYVLTEYSKKAKVDQDRMVKGVDMVKASNQKARSSITIPHGVMLPDIAHHVHYYCGGLYATGLGYYLAGNTWYVFPAFDNTRFDDGKPTLTIINVPKSKLPGIERTYRKDGDNLVVLSTGDTKFKSMSNRNQLNQGNGLRFADASKMMEDFSSTSGNKTTISRGSNNTEAVGTQRKNKINVVATADRQINANPYVEFSRLAMRQGEGINLVWENGNRSLLYPGMPTKIMYLDGDDVREMYGVLQGAHEYAALRDTGVTATRYSSAVSLHVFVKQLDSDAQASDS
jgi:hypothetical protein